MPYPIRYIFREPLFVKGASDADPQAIGEELDSIRSEDGALTAGGVVKRARPPTSLLHRHFEWDDRKAAEQYRLDQARMLIRCIRIEGDDSDQEPTVAFLSIASGSGPRSYFPSGEVTKSLDLSTTVLRAALRDLENFKKRYQRLTELCSIVEEARQVAEKKLRRKENPSTKGRRSASGARA